MGTLPREYDDGRRLLRAYIVRMWWGQKIERARELRQRQTRAEALAWKLLRDRRLGGLKFRRQQAIGPFIADFYCHKLRLVLELDGAIHNTPKQINYDIGRTKYLRSLGLRVVRLPNHRVTKDNIWKAIFGASDSKPPADIARERGHSRGVGLGPSPPTDLT